jgi:hypothetical protein
MKFITERPLADPNVAASKLIEIASSIEAVQDGRIYIELVNAAFLEAGGTPDQYRAALARAISKGWLWRHESGTYVKFTPRRCRHVRLMVSAPMGFHERQK